MKNIKLKDSFFAAGFYVLLCLCVGECSKIYDKKQEIKRVEAQTKISYLNKPLLSQDYQNKTSAWTGISLPPEN